MSIALDVAMPNKRTFRHLAVTVGLTSIAGCSERSGVVSGGMQESRYLRGANAVPKARHLDAGEAQPMRDARITPPTPDARVIAPMCKNPTLGSVGSLSFVSLTGTAVDKCLGGDTSHCSGSAFVDPNDVALDYGDFPFSRETAGGYFYAVVAAGFEETGFFHGAPGNLSDDVPSAVEGDHGGGDALADRTIVVAGGQVPLLFPASRGTHAFSFPPSQFMTIHLLPFDTTPDGRYVLVVCPTTATSRCDCAFDAFTIVPPVIDAGSGGNPGTGGAPGGGGAGDAAADAHATGGAGGDAGMCPDR
jgi:hypothetical protein